ncbi:MAG: hypothetical protein ACYTG7_20785 [Planctomycetota bacterium]|jgi:hypothetical protein
MEHYIPRPGDLVPLLPGAALAIVFLFAAALFHRREGRRIAVVFAGLSLAAGHVLGYFWIQGTPAFPAVQSTERMVYAIPLFALGSTLSSLLALRGLLKRILGFGLSAGMVLYLLAPLVRLAATDPSHVGWLEVLLLALGMYLYWLMVEDLAGRKTAPALPLILSLLMGLYGQIFVMYGAAKLAQLAGTAAIALGVSTLLCRWLPESGFPRAGAGAFIAVLAGIGLDGCYFTFDAPPLLALVLPLGAPLLLYLFLLKPVEKLGALPRFALQMLVAALPLLAAFWIAVVPVLEREPNPYKDLY